MKELKDKKLELLWIKLTIYILLSSLFASLALILFQCYSTITFSFLMINPMLACFYFAKTEKDIDWGINWSFKGFNKGISYTFVFITVELIRVALSIFLQIDSSDSFFKFKAESFVFDLLSDDLIGFICVFLIAISQELLWRGFFNKLLRFRFNRFKSALIVGVIWFAFYLPLMLIYNSNLPLTYVIVLFFSLISMSTVFEYIRKNSENIWTVIVLHAYLIIQGILYSHNDINDVNDIQILILRLGLWIILAEFLIGLSIKSSNDKALKDKGEMM